MKLKNYPGFRELPQNHNRIVNRVESSAIAFFLFSAAITGRKREREREADERN